jgi:hypothetical protein
MRLLWLGPSPGFSQVGSDLSEPTVSSKTDNRRMSSDMSGPLSDKPDGTTPNAASASDTRSVTADTSRAVRHVWQLPPLWWVIYPAGTASVLWLRGKPHGKLPGLY